MLMFIINNPIFQEQQHKNTSVGVRQRNINTVNTRVVDPKGFFSDSDPLFISNSETTGTIFTRNVYKWCLSKI
jgi:hypothetical protein